MILVVTVNERLPSSSSALEAKRIGSEWMLRSYGMRASTWAPAEAYRSKSRSSVAVMVVVTVSERLPSSSSVLKASRIGSELLGSS